MKLIKFLLRESEVSWNLIMVMAVVSGIANGLLLAFINAGAALSAEGELSGRLFVMFMTTFLIFYLSKKYTLVRATDIVETIIRKIRVRLVDKIRSTSYRNFETVSKSDIYTRITEDTQTISSSAQIIISGCQALMMLIFAFIYIAWISRLAIMFTMIAIALGFIVYLANRKGLIESMTLSSRKESEFFARINNVLNGFKEAKINMDKSNALFDDLVTVSREAEELKKDLGQRVAGLIMHSQVFFYLLIASLVFVLPKLTPQLSETILKLSASVLFIIGPVEMVATAVPDFSRATVSVDNIEALEAQLDSAIQDYERPVEKELKPLRFKSTLSFKDVEFNYRDEQGNTLFAIHPLNLTIPKGSITMLVGGNGSGKTTVLKILTGLYYPANGRIEIDGRALLPRQYRNYRALFSTVFADFYLFPKLYGVSEKSLDRAEDLLHMMKVEHKTAIENNAFTNIDLSTGQRKRLALITSMLEDRQIMVFDEWAAEQDPEFREFFYTEILSKLKALGKTLIIVSHDDRYFHLADSIYKLDYGTIMNNEISSDLTSNSHTEPGEA